MTMQTPLLINEPLAVHDVPSRGMARQLRSVGQGTALAATYGVALGIGATEGHVLGLAVAVPITFAASLAVAIPSLYVVLAMLEAPMELSDLLNAATEAYRHSALMLGGLAPTLLLCSASIADRSLVHLLGYNGLVLAAALGAYRLTSEARLSLLKRVEVIQTRHWVILLAFIGLAFQLAERFWTASVSLSGGVS